MNDLQNELQAVRRYHSIVRLRICRSLLLSMTRGTDSTPNKIEVNHLI